MEGQHIRPDMSVHINYVAGLRKGVLCTVSMDLWMILFRVELLRFVLYSQFNRMFMLYKNFHKSVDCCSIGIAV